MPVRKLALIGATKGPWVSIKGMETPHVEVHGLGSGLLKVYTDYDSSLVAIDRDGVHPIPAGGFTMIHYEGPKAKGLICTIVSRNAA